MDSQDKTRFEIHGKSSVKYHLKANHVVEAKRWFWTLNNAIQWAKDEDKEEQKRQKHDTDELKRARMEQYVTISTPIPVNNKLSATTTTQLYDDLRKYRSLVGALQFLTTTRLDISYVVDKLCQFMDSPTNDYWVVLKQVLRYVKGTLDYVLRLIKSDSEEIYAFLDSDWARCLDDRKLTHVYY